MRKLKLVVSLTTNDSDYQMEQAACAGEASRRLEVGVEILFAENDTILQSQQLLKIVQSKSEFRPDGIIFEPVGGTALPVVADAATKAGIAWVIMNREADYIHELRKSYSIPIFTVGSDHVETGRIQGRQFAALLPNGGTVLYIEGPPGSSASGNRTIGMHETKPANVNIKVMKGNWTEGSAYKAVVSWLKLSTSVPTTIDVVAAQNDAMAVGAHKAFQEIGDSKIQSQWLALPYLGVDGVVKTGQEWVRSGLLTATIVNPPNTIEAIEMLVNALRTNVMPPELTYTIPKSFPDVEKLASAYRRKLQSRERSM